MPYYNYLCLDCIDYAEKELGRELTDKDKRVFLFEARHGMDAPPEEVKKLTECPFCDGHNTRKTMLDVDVHTFVRGHDWGEFRKNNASALRRDMALHQLKNEDPYASMRAPGEADDLAHRLETGGKRDPGRLHFDMGKSVDSSKDQPATD